MLEEIKKKIDTMQKDTTSYKMYIKSFCESKNAEELFSKNDDFNALKDSIDNKNKSKKEDEYF